MTTAVNDTSVPLARLNIFDDPAPFNRVTIAGLLVLALVTKFNGVKIEDIWKMQKSKSASGGVFSFNGTNPVGGEQGMSISFRVTTRAEFDQLYDLYDALKPVPVLGGGAGSGSSSATAVQNGSQWTVGSPPKPADSSSAESLLAQAQAALKSLNSPTPAASSADPAAAQTAATAPQPSPGPRPPTVPIENAFLAFLGVFAVARAFWDFSDLGEDKIEVTIGFIHDKPPTPAGVGAMSAPKPAGSQFVNTPSKSAANAGAAGT